MTNSTDKAKKPKKTGPIRWEAVIPTTVILIVIGVYFHLFFDGHMRRALEYIGTQVNGAEVNIGRFRTDFFGARLEIDDIQVTDKNKPERNIAQIGKIRFELLWDALLRAKFVINEAKILEIESLSPRQRAGFVVPPPPPEKPGTSTLARIQNEVLSQTRKKFNDNFMGDLAAVLGGVDPKEQLKNIESELKSDARIKELEKELREKSAKWEQRIKELPQAQQMKEYEGRIKALKFNGNNPIELAENIKEADKIFKEIEQKVKLIDQASKDANGDAAHYTQAFKDLENMIQEDVKDLQKRLKIPSLDGKEFSQQLFMSMIERRLAGFSKYVEVARHYMPPKRSESDKQARKEEELVPRKRGQGKNFRFPITTGYPLFWLKTAAISSEASKSNYSGNIKGEIKDLTSDPDFIQKPTVITLAGDFPGLKILGLDAKVTLDHTTETAREQAYIKIQKFPVDGYSFVNSSDVNLGLESAQGTTTVNASLANSELDMEIQSAFTEPSYSVDAKNKQVKEILDSVVKGISRITLNAGIKGSLSDFKMNVNSNLGDELAQGFKKQLDAKIADAQVQLRKIVDARVGQEKDRLKGEIDKNIGRYVKDLDLKKADIDKAVKEAKAQIEKDKGKGAGKKLEEEGKKLLKKFKLGG